MWNFWKSVGWWISVRPCQWQFVSSARASVASSETKAFFRINFLAKRKQRNSRKNDKPTVFSTSTLIQSIQYTERFYQGLWWAAWRRQPLKGCPSQKRPLGRHKAPPSWFQRFLPCIGKDCRERSSSTYRRTAEAQKRASALKNFTNAFEEIVRNSKSPAFATSSQSTIGASSFPHLSLCRKCFKKVISVSVFPVKPWQ